MCLPLDETTGEKGDGLCKLSGVGDYLNTVNCPIWRPLSFPGEPGESHSSEQKSFYYQAAEPACPPEFLTAFKKKNL